MKYRILLIFSLILAIGTISYSQCDVYASDPAITGFGNVNAVSCIAEGGTVDMEVSWYLNCYSEECLTPSGSWYIIITFPLTGEYGILDASSVVGPEFDWTYYPSEKTLVGILAENLYVDNSAFPPITESGTVSFTVTGFDGDEVCSQIPCSAQLQITQTGPGACLSAFNDQIVNNYQPNSLGIDMTLPLDFISMDLSSNFCESNDLAWVTGNEQDNDYFAILRKIDDGQFEEIGRIDGKNKEYNEYSFKDDMIIAGKHTVYYRVKQVDFDGKISYSPVKVVNSICITNENIEIYPNPAMHSFSVNLSKLAYVREEPVMIELIDTHGKKAMVNMFENIPETGVLKFEVEDNVDAGLYLCVIKSKDLVLKTQRISLMK